MFEFAMTDKIQSLNKKVKAHVYFAANAFQYQLSPARQY